MDITRLFPAEWDYPSAILIGWPHADTDWAPMLPEVTACYVALAEAITADTLLIVTAPDLDVPRTALAHLPQERIIYIEAPSNDTWARDYGPLTAYDTKRGIRLLDFTFNGWGMKFAACHDNLINRRLADSGLFTATLENHLGFVLEGGGVESDGRGTILSTTHCLTSPNRNGGMSLAEIEDRLCRSLGAVRVLCLEHGHLEGDDTDSHIDTLARFVPNDTILYVKCDDPADSHYDDLAAMESELSSLRTMAGMPYNLVGLPMPSPIYDEDGERLPATYANFLVTDRAVYMPVYGQEANDRLATMTVRVAFPNHVVRTVDCRPLIRQHGSLHCATMQLPLAVIANRKH